MTTRSGFGPKSAQMAELVGHDMSPEHGWRKIFDSTAEPAFSPHYEAYNWAVLLWAYSHSELGMFLERAQLGITTMMEGYPQSWIPTSNGIAMQRARILLPLAWLVRVNDTQIHRLWLQTAVDGLLTLRHCPVSLASRPCIVCSVPNTCFSVHRKHLLLGAPFARSCRTQGGEEAHVLLRTQTTALLKRH